MPKPDLIHSHSLAVSFRGETPSAAGSSLFPALDMLAEAHCSFGYSRLHYDWDWTAAEAEFKRALALNPNYSHVHHWYSHLLTVAGRSEESLEHSLRIIELDPFDLIINVHLAWHYQMAGKFQAALDEARKLIEMESSFHWGYYFSGLALEQMDSARDAVRALERSVELSGSTVMLSALGHAHAMAGDRDRAVTVLRKLEDLSATRYVSSYEVGLIFAALDDRDRAFEWLEKAFAERSGWMPYIAVEPRLKRLREEACFKDFLRRLNLPNS